MCACEPYSHFSHRNRSINTVHAWCLPYVTLSVNDDLITSELRSINCCHMSMGIFFLSGIYNHQCTHLHKSAADTDTNFNPIHDFNWPRRHHTQISEFSTWRKAIRTLFDESEVKLRVPLWKSTLDDDKYITSWQCFTSRDIHTLYYWEHGTLCKYAWILN